MLLAGLPRLLLLIPVLLLPGGLLRLLVAGLLLAHLLIAGLLLLLLLRAWLLLRVPPGIPRLLRRG